MFSSYRYTTTENLVKLHDEYKRDAFENQQQGFTHLAADKRRRVRATAKELILRGQLDRAQDERPFSARLILAWRILFPQ